MKKKILCVIPARSGSKGLRNKNIRILNKKPLIAWSIIAAKKCKLIDKIIVSTDSTKIAKVAKKYGAETPFIRPKKFATDKASSFSVLKHAIEFYKNQNINYDYILMLEPTSPLRDINDIIYCINKIKKTNIKTIVSLTKVEDQHPNFLYSISNKNYLKPYINSKKLYIRRQDVSSLFYLEGSIYISKISTLLKEKTWYHKNTQAFLVDKWKSLEIDDIEDFKLAEIFIKRTNL